MITFTVPGKPQGKARARTFYNRRTKKMASVTPENTVLYENHIKYSYIHANGRHRIDGPVSATINVFYRIPKSTTKKERAEIDLGRMLPTKKPDVDNIAKVILDALNGIAYDDDKQVVELIVRKHYSMRERVEVTLTEKR